MRENAERLFNDHWKPFEAPFWSIEEKQGRYKKARIEFFLANFIAGQIAGEVNLSKLFSEYKAFLKRRKFADVRAELQELARYGAIYRELVERSADNPLGRFSRRLLPWDVTTVFPLVLRLWSDETIEDSEKSVCLDFLLSFVVRRAICGLTNKNYNKLFLSAVAHLDQHGWSAEKLVGFLSAQKSDIGRLPRDEEFEQRWIATPIYTSLQPARARAILEEIELAKRGRFHETTTLAPQLTVEHVLPREWAAHWPMPDGTAPSPFKILSAIVTFAEDDSMDGRIVRRERLKETIGNLPLLTQPLNSSISNGPYAGKRTALQDHSLLVLNREITQYEDWNEDRILDRSRSLFPFARTIWAVPTAESGV